MLVLIIVLHKTTGSAIGKSDMFNCSNLHKFNG